MSKPKKEKKYSFSLTEGEIIIIREAMRKIPLSEMTNLYDREMMTVDRKMTDKLADIFDEKNGIKKPGA